MSILTRVAGALRAAADAPRRVLPSGPWVVGWKKRLAWRAAELGIELPTSFRASRPLWDGPAMAVAVQVRQKAGLKAHDVKRPGWLDGYLRAYLVGARNPAAARPAFVATMLRLAKAEADAHVVEEPPGSNDGPRVRQYQDVTGAYREPWCASFCCWLLRNAGYTAPLPVLPAYCPSWEEKARGQSDGWLLVDPSRALPGDFVLFDFPPVDGVAQHIGIVTRAAADGLVDTIEGNTSTSSNDNGGAVLARTRELHDVRACVRVPTPTTKR